MGYLEQFARNKRRKEKSEVLTARLPHSLYEDFKTYCDELGLSISEAVCLLVEREMTGSDNAFDEVATTKEYIKNTNSSDDEVKTNTKSTTNVVKKNTKENNSNTKRFTVKQWVVNDKLPCPICGEWKTAGNFLRHAKTHGMTTEQIFTNEGYREKIELMVAELKNNL
ncbi:hypothetical protein VSK70_26660 [Bacillus sp. WOD8 KX774193]|uniref:hypothetical protein n=1 Tax=Bacillus TaxID=1386 RepID=UPI000A3BB043|nr:MULTISPECIES: hypothetical protein [Bacillus]MCU5032452.1 hypothetical protein [Bacillus cereus]MRA75562.1 hypothetical protein [Bacillus thuringiensis]MEC3859482.1 hypothetical protein [Bacillus sp. WOD8 KX774193]MRA94050.1 hypothetical protein [Bacillus thuringiensis]MRC56760.1 hypothetical protein [Bacillus thuringiensis]